MLLRSIAIALLIVGALFAVCAPLGISLRRPDRCEEQLRACQAERPSERSAVGSTIGEGR